MARPGRAASWPWPRWPGCRVDEGAEALLTRRPEGTGLIEAVGLAGELVPAGHHRGADLDPRRDCARCRPASSWACPRDLAELARPGSCPLPGWPGPARTRSCRHGPGGRRAGGQLRGARFGPEVVDRLVDPLLGGVYAGRSDELSFEATLPGAGRGVAAARHADRRRGRAAAATGGRRCPPRPRRCSPRWPAASARCRPRLAARRAARSVRTGAMVPRAGAAARRAGGSPSARRTTRSGWTPTRSSSPCPARPASRLLAGVPGAAAAAARARRDQLREHGDRHPRLPARRVPAAARTAAATWSPPWTAIRSRRSRSPR